MKMKSLLPLVAILAITSCGAEPTFVTFKIKDFEGDVEVHTSLQLEKFINKSFDYIKDNPDYPAGVASGTDCSGCEPVRISWEAIPDQGKVKEYSVLISAEAFGNSTRMVTTDKNYVELNNLYLNTVYTYRFFADNKFFSETYTFKTVSTGPRNLTIDGVRNVRDLGGYGHIRQGLIYRGGSFEEIDENSGKLVVNITGEGGNDIRRLGIKTEIDVRRNKPDSKGQIENCSLTKSTVEGVDNYFALPMYYGGKDILTYVDDDYNNPARIKEFMELLAVPENYPIYFHCTHGKDRTGGLAYVIEALMGLEEEYLYRDYLFSNFAKAPSYNLKPTGISGKFGKTINKYLSDVEMSLAERTYRYLNEVIGVSTDDLNNIIDILKVH